MVECGGLENRWARERLEGSNPSLSAMVNAEPAFLWDAGFFLQRVRDSNPVKVRS